MKNLKLSAIALLAVFSFYSCSSDDDSSDDTSPDVKRAELYASNNSNGNITKYDVKDRNNVTSKTFLTLSLDSEGIFYDGSSDEVTQASRSLLQLNSYADVSVTENGALINANLSSAANLVSPRDIAVNGNIYVVADNADVDGDPDTADGRFFIYTKSSNGFTLRNTVTVNFKVWGIEFIGNDLFAVVDATSDLAVFTNFAASNTTNATVEASKRITIEGIVRTHGIAFDGGTMILTDIGAAMGAGSDTDGAFHVITDFQNKFNAVANGGIMAVSGNQVRVAGANTFLGNPVAAEFDAETNTVFIAERANAGGRVLAFT
nr:hypothetical protein [Flavobacteriales bacterium]